MNTHMNRVYTDKYGCRWVQMGLHGCAGVQEHKRTTKQGKKNQKQASRACFLPLWPGKFPRT